MQSGSALARQTYIEILLEHNQGQWPDLEGLIFEIYNRFVTPGDVVIDVGVNHGTHLFHLARAVGVEGHVFGVEPVPSHIASVNDQLRSHYSDLAERITLHACAVSSEAGEAEFFVSRVNDGGLSGLRFRDVLKPGEVDRIMVQVKVLDDIIPADRPVRFLKIDVEGAEFNVLKGATRILENRPAIAFEFDASAPNYFAFSAAEFMAFFESRDYVVSDLFGFPVRSAADLLSAKVWNFVATPKDIDPVTFTEPARRALETRFASLTSLAPVRSVS